MAKISRHHCTLVLLLLQLSCQPLLRITILMSFYHNTGDRSKTLANRQKLAKYFRGSARVPLAVLTFRDAGAPKHTDAKNIERLVRSFSLGGCDRLDPENRIPTIVTKAWLDETLQKFNISSSQLFTDSPPLIPIKDQSIYALQGRIRTLAAKRFLPPSEHWWIVDFYMGMYYSV